jgi:hypothetical protein
MKSGLWKLRREKDGRILEVWKELWKEDRKMENSSYEEKSTREEEPSPGDEEDDRWMEELTLTDMERRKLEESEIWYLTTNSKTNYIFSSSEPSLAKDFQSPGLTSPPVCPIRKKRNLENSLRSIHDEDHKPPVQTPLPRILTKSNSQHQKQCQSIRYTITQPQPQPFQSPSPQPGSSNMQTTDTPHHPTYPNPAIQPAP